MLLTANCYIVCKDNDLTGSNKQTAKEIFLASFEETMEFLTDKFNELKVPSSTVLEPDNKPFDGFSSDLTTLNEPKKRRNGWRMKTAASGIAWLEKLPIIMYDELISCLKDLVNSHLMGIETELDFVENNDNNVSVVRSGNNIAVSFYLCEN